MNYGLCSSAMQLTVRGLCGGGAVIQYSKDYHGWNSILFIVPGPFMFTLSGPPMGISSQNHFCWGHTVLGNTFINFFIAAYSTVQYIQYVPIGKIHSLLILEV